MLNKIIIYEDKDSIFTMAYDQDQQIKYFLRDSKDNLVNAIYLAKVVQFNFKNRIAFVEYLDNQRGIINLDKNIKVQCGTMLACQLTWRGNESKLAKLNTKIRISGKYVVFLPNTKEHYLSKKLNKSKILNTISQKYAMYGLIFRTAINNLIDFNILEDEIKSLVKYQDLINKSVKYNISQQIIAGEFKYQLLLKNMEYASNLIITTNYKPIFKQLSQVVDLWQINELNLDDHLLIDIEGLQQQIKDGIQIIASGINIHKLSDINLIDIDSKDAALSFYQVNYLAVDKIVKVIKLYDLSGIILIDFIKNMSREEEEQILIKLGKLCELDWRKTSILGFTRAGICEIIRNK